MRGAVRYCICNFMWLSCISRLQCLVQTEISVCRGYTILENGEPEATIMISLLKGDK